MSALCGTCLGVRDQASQLSRALVVTDAAALAVLAASLAPDETATRHAGPCPGRGMRTASVLAPHTHAVRAGVAATLLSASIKMADYVRDGDAPGGRAGGVLAAAAHRRTLPRAERAAARAGVDAALVHAAVAASSATERRASAVLCDWTEPAAVATAELFRAAAPGFATDMVAIGREVGAATLLADAAGDLDDDRERGRPNPILAGACSRDDAVTAMNASAGLVARRVRALTGDGLATALWGPAWTTGLRRSAGLAPRCRTTLSYTPEWGPGPEPPASGRAGDAHDAGAPADDLGERARRRLAWCNDTCLCCDCPCDCCVGSGWCGCDGGCCDCGCDCC